MLKFLSCILFLLGLSEFIEGVAQLYGFRVSHHALYNITGSFSNPGPYAGFLAVIFPIALYWTLKLYPSLYCLNKEIFKRILLQPKKAGDYITFGLASLYVFGCFSILPATMSRSAWLAAAAGGSLVVCRHYNCHKGLKKYYKTNFHKCIFAVVTSVFLIIAVCYSMYQMKKDSADGRLLLWKISWLAFQENPWYGVGPNKFGGAFGRNQAAYFASGKGTPNEEKIAGSPVYGFNEFLQIGVERGITGLSIFLLITGLALSVAISSKTTGSTAIAGSLTSFLLFACFSYPFSISLMQKLFVSLLLAAVWGCSGSLQNRRLQTWTARGLVLIPLAYLLISERQSPEMIKARQQWQEEQYYYQMKIYEGTVDHYRELYPLLRNNIEFLFEYGQCLSKTGQYEESNRILHEGAERSADPMFHNIIGQNYQALKQYQEAEKAFYQAIYRVPHRLLPYYFLTKMYFNSGDTIKARITAKILLEKKPKVMSPAVNEMKEEISKLLNL